MTLKGTGAQGGRDYSVLEHHKNPSRNGLYIEPSFTREAAAGLQLDFTTPILGVVNAQPLFVDGLGKNPDLLVVATEENYVAAIDPTTGVVIWERILDSPLPGHLVTEWFGYPCGRWDPIGITGTPVIDEAARRIYLDVQASDEIRVAAHLVYALSLDDGSTVPGWPVDIGSSVPEFTAIIQPQRGALTLLNDRVYVPFGSHSDCGNYRGWLVGISTADPESVIAWSTEQLSAIWAPSGVASDGTSLFVATANGLSEEWNGSNAIIRLDEGPTFSGSPEDYVVPLDWRELDAEDLDLGGSGVTLVDLPEADLHLALALGKDGKMYLADRSNLGGIGGALVAELVSDNAIITAPSTYTTEKGTFVTFTAYGGHAINCPGSINIVTIRIDPTPPLSISNAWCAQAPGAGSTIVTTTDGMAESIVWVVGAKFGALVYGFDGDTGALIAAAEGTDLVIRYTAPIVAKGRLYAAGTDQLYAFALK
jgi:hypothetical protein